MSDRPLPPIVEGHLNLTQGPQTVSAIGSVEVISLPKEDERQRLSVDERIALSDQRLRIIMVISFAIALIVGDVATFGTLCWWTRLDQANLAQKLITTGERIVDRQVALALLGATTVQVGAIAAIIAGYLFPRRTSHE